MTRSGMSESKTYEVVNMYELGVSVDDICDEMQIAKHQVYYALKQHNVRMRAGKKQMIDRFETETLEEFLEDYRAGDPVGDIVEKYGLSGPTAIYTLLRQMGEHPRSRSTQYLEGKKGQMDDAIRMYQEGHPIWYIVSETGIQQPALHKEIHVRKIPMRNQRYGS